MGNETDPRGVNLAKTDSAEMLQVFREFMATKEGRAEFLRLERAAREREWAEHKERLRAKRAEIRANAERRELTVDALIEVLEDKTGLDHVAFTREYATHLVQPYCTCGLEDAVWVDCEHARDEGF